MNYIDTIYNLEKTPLTTYPLKLAAYLTYKYNLYDYHHKNLIDIGCGRGDFSMAFSKLNFKVFSVDRDKNENHENLYFMHYINDLNTDYYANNEIRFDVVFCKSVLEHLSNPEHFIKESYEILNKNGKIVLMVPDWNTQKDFFYDDPTHIHPYTQKSLYDFLVMNNFKNVKSEVFYQLPIVWKYPKLKYLCKFLQFAIKANQNRKNKFLRWSTETMLLAIGEK